MILTTIAAAIAATAQPVTIHTPFDAPQTGQGQVTAQLAIDADYEFFVLNGLSVDATVSAIEEILGAVSAAFEDGPGVAFDVTAVVVRTDPNDPYSTNDAASLFQQVKNEWLANQDVEWDVVQLFTGKNLNGAIVGLAGPSSICTTNAISVVAPAGLPFVGQAHLSAHELGHVFGAENCFDAPDCGVMCSSFVGCPGDPLVFGQDAVDQIQALIDDQGDCLESGCLADCNVDGALNILDFVCYQNLFNTGDLAADCNNDGVLNILDFVCFQNAFNAGC